MDEHDYLNQLVKDVFRRQRGRPKRRQKPTKRSLSSHEKESFIQTAEERRALAVSSLLLQQVQEHGGTHVSREALLALSSRALDSLEDADRAAIMEEVVGVLDWLARQLASPEQVNDRNSWGDVYYDTEAWRQSSETAIEAGDDLRIDYFSFHRGEWSQRRITPLRVKGEFVVGHCHLRGDERKFRLSRIRSMEALSVEADEAVEPDEVLVEALSVEADEAVEPDEVLEQSPEPR